MNISSLTNSLPSFLYLLPFLSKSTCSLSFLTPLSFLSSLPLFLSFLFLLPSFLVPSLLSFFLFSPCSFSTSCSLLSPVLSSLPSTLTLSLLSPLPYLLSNFLLFSSIFSATSFPASLKSSPNSRILPSGSSTVSSNQFNGTYFLNGKSDPESSTNVTKNNAAKNTPRTTNPLTNLLKESAIASIIIPHIT